MASIPWVASSDFHGDKHDPVARKLFFSFVEEYRPRLRFFLGDIWDFRAWRVGATEEEKRERVYRDFKSGMDFLEAYRPTGITLGNHDARLWDQVEKHGPMSDYCADLIAQFQKLVRKLKCRVKPYDKRKGVLQVGKLKMAHGFFDGENAAKQMAEAYGSILCGHGHAIDVVSTPGPEPHVGRMIGCLCRLDFTYNRRNVSALRQKHGWAYGPMFDNGTYHAFQAERIGETIVYAESHKTLSAK